MEEQRTHPIPLFINHIAGLDWLVALEYGTVDDGQPKANWRGVSEQLGYLCSWPGGPEIGFKVCGFSSFDPEDPQLAEIWSGPRFHAPTLGLRHASTGEIALAVRAFVRGQDTINRYLFNRAVDSHGERAAFYWRACLQAGDMMAHFGLGYTLVELGRHREAYRHLRAYVEIVPDNAWNWCWLGKACEGMGELSEARSAYRRAIELEEAGGDETDARESLKRLDPG